MKLTKSKLILVLLFLSLLSIHLSGQNGSSFKPFFFIQITDPQFGMIESNKGFCKETELYKKAVQAVNRLNPDFVVITGDFVNDKTDSSQIKEFKRITAQIDLKIPVYFSPGNHDIGQSPGQNDIDVFVSEYGYDSFTFKKKDCLFIGLNSCLIKSNTPILEQQQFDWLKNVLSEGRTSKHIIVFCHYPFFLKTFDEPETYSNIPVNVRMKYLALFREMNVETIFAGHLHNNSVAKFGKMEMITTSAVGKPLANAPSGIRIIKVFADRLESIYYSLDEIPEAIGLK
jgi:serine/threonine-protein phosphatase CPPED1